MKMTKLGKTLGTIVAVAAISFAVAGCAGPENPVEYVPVKQQKTLKTEPYTLRGEVLKIDRLPGTGDLEVFIKPKGDVGVELYGVCLCEPSSIARGVDYFPDLSIHDVVEFSFVDGSENGNMCYDGVRAGFSYDLSITKDR